MRKIGVIGYFGYKNNQIDGQTIKTQQIYKLIRSHIDNSKICYIDTYELKIDRFKTIVKLLWIVIICNTIVYLPGKNNLQRFFPILYWISKLLHHSIIYPVVGGWLANYLVDKPQLQDKLKQIKAILVESKRLKKELEENFEFKNVSILTNFRSINYTPYPNIMEGILRVVFMARITESKGCNIIFEIADRLLSNNINNVKFTFFGQIDTEYKETFYKGLVKNKENCEYCGIVVPEYVYPTLNQFDLLILPTFYEGEGFPGSIVDAYKSGIPVLVSDWKDLPEYVKDGETGYVLKRNTDLFYNKICEIRSNPAKLQEMKIRAFNESKLYSDKEGWNILSQFL